MTLCRTPICLRIDFEILIITFIAIQGLSQNIYPNCCPPANWCSARSLLTIPMLKHEKDEVFILRFLKCGMDCLRNSSSLHLLFWKMYLLLKIFFPSFFLAWSLNSRNLQWLLGKFQEATLPQNNYFHLLILRKVPAFQTWDFIANETNEAVCLLFSEVQMCF